MTKQITSPELFVDDHHGQYMGQLAWQYLADEYKEQARKVLSAEDIASLEAGPDDEFYFDACDALTRVTFMYEGQEVGIQYAEGGMWIIPESFYGTPESEEFFGG